MDPQWDDSLPIYRQLRDRVVAMILEGVLREGDPLPSVRSVAAEFRLNPLTVLKGYQQLVDEQLVEKRRGRGMYVSDGARKALMKDERQRFLEEEWPKVLATIQRLGLSVSELLRSGAPASPVPYPTTVGSGGLPVPAPGGPPAGGQAQAGTAPVTPVPASGSRSGGSGEAQGGVPDHNENGAHHDDSD